MRYAASLLFVVVLLAACGEAEPRKRSHENRQQSGDDDIVEGDDDAATGDDDVVAGGDEEQSGDSDDPIQGDVDPTLCGLGTYTPQAGDSWSDDEALAELEGYTRFGGTIYIGANVTSFASLHCLERIDDSIWVNGVDGVTTFAGLEALTYVGGELVFENLATLTSFSGLENITHVEEAIWITNMPLMSHCEIERIQAVWEENDTLASDGQYIIMPPFADAACE